MKEHRALGYTGRAPGVLKEGDVIEFHLGGRKTAFSALPDGLTKRDVVRQAPFRNKLLYPADNKDPSKPGRLRLMYEAAPMAMVMEQAGGAASDGTNAMLDVVPDALHQRVPVMIGSKAEIETFLTYR